MKFRETALDGVFTIELERHVDDRGFFARVFCARELEAAGLSPTLVQASTSYNTRKGTLRGMHYQREPGQETKIVRCVRGAVHDVVLDIRAGSRTFGTSVGVTLSAENRAAIYVPKGCAHGFLTLEDDAEVFYFMDGYHDPALAQGVRWNDPAFAIRWPAAPVVVSDRDRSYPDWPG